MRLLFDTTVIIDILRGSPAAIIVACASAVQARLVTHNRKHFPMFDDLSLPNS